MSLLLSAMVLVWSLSPPAVQHAHEGGTDLSHHHDSAPADHDATDGACQSHYGSDSSQSHAATVVPVAIAGEASHLHFQWLGFRLTLPHDNSPTKKGEDRNASKLLFVQASRASVSQLHSSGQFDKSLMLPSLDAIVMDIAAPCRAISCYLPRVTPCPLCDRARHERSGVLLS